MNEFLSLPWLEAAIAVPLLGAVVVGRIRDPYRAARWGLLIAMVVLAFAFLAGFAFVAGVGPGGSPMDVQMRLFGIRLFHLDELNAPLVPTVALLHFLTALATARTKMRRFSLPWSLASAAVTLALFSCTEPWTLVFLLSVGTVPPVLELLNRDRPIRVYILHMGLFVGLLVVGWSLVDAGSIGAGSALLFAAVLVRCGVVPAHCWLTDWFENASFGRALLFVAPLTGVYAAIRLVMPIAAEWVLQSLGWASLGTAIYAAGLATVQLEARRFFAFLFLSHASLVLVGLEVHTNISLTGSLRLWSSVILSLGGLGLTLRALEARVGRLSLTRYHGLYDHSPALAVCFMLTGLCSVGFPGTAGFVATEMLVDGAVEASPWVGVGVLAAAALNGIAIIRVYFLLFTGTRHPATVPLGITLRERMAVLTLAALLIGGGLAPQQGVLVSHRATKQILKDRESRAARTAEITRLVRVTA
jgi:NADH-quinone oxidoreductase subunit M